MLHINGLTKSYGDHQVLRGVDLEARAGEIVGLLGPNGAGKTTIVSIVAGLRRADAGTVTVDAIDALAHPEQAREILGLAPQDLGIYPCSRWSGTWPSSPSCPGCQARRCATASRTSPTRST